MLVEIKEDLKVEPWNRGTADFELGKNTYVGHTLNRYPYKLRPDKS